MVNHKSVLVTGGAGYVGSVLVKKLVDEEFSVTVIDSLIFGKDGISELIDKNQIKFFNFDLRETTKIDNILENIDCIKSIVDSKPRQIVITQGKKEGWVVFSMSRVAKLAVTYPYPIHKSKRITDEIRLRFLMSFIN